MLRFRIRGGAPVCLVVNVRAVCVLYLYLYPLLYIGAVRGKPVSCIAQQGNTTRRQHLTISWHKSISFMVISWSLYYYICDLFNGVLRTLDSVT